MRDGRPDGATGARLYATAAGSFLAILGLGGFLLEGSFASGEALIADESLGVAFNGWQSMLYLGTGLLGLLMAARAAFGYVALSALLWTVLALGGFFGAHGGEAVPSMADRLLATGPNNVLALALAALAWLVIAARRADVTRRKVN